MNEKQPAIDLIKSLSTKDLIREFDGWIEGHVTFESGEHGNGYMDKRFLRYPAVMTEIGRRLADQVSDMKNEIDVVVSPAIIGAIIAYSVASNLEVSFATTYRQYGTGEMTFHRGFVPPKSNRCLFVDDFVSNGRCLKDNYEFIQRSGLVFIGASVIGLRAKLDIPEPIRSLMLINFTKSPSESCLLCKQNIPIIATNIRE